MPFSSSEMEFQQSPDRLSVDINIFAQQISFGRIKVDFLSTFTPNSLAYFFLSTSPPILFEKMFNKDVHLPKKKEVPHLPGPIESPSWP